MKKFVYIVMIVLLAILIVNNSLTDQYVAKLRGAQLVSQKADPLYEEIASKREDFEVKPVDARVDPVWKAIPGYNGLKVDVEASYEKMKDTGDFKTAQLVFQQVEPKVHLKDLPPAPVYKGNPNKPMVGFVINVAWGNEYLSSILATLKKNNVHASFFLEGKWVKNNPELANLIAGAGHEIGNHSYSHPNMKQISAARIRDEIRKTNEVIKATVGKNPAWLAPPSGSYRDEVVKIASEENLGTVLWSVDTVDWRKPSPNDLLIRVLSKIHNGALVLMHPTESTAQALEQLIQQIKDKNLEIGTVTQLLSEDRIRTKALELDEDKTALQLSTNMQFQISSK